MSAELNSKIGAQLDPMGADTRGSKPMAGDESEVPMTQTSLEVKSVFGSIAIECAASVTGSILPSSDGMIFSGLKAEVIADAISRTLSDGRVTSCSS